MYNHLDAATVEGPLVYPEGPSLRGLLAEPDMRGLVASVLAVARREVETGIARPPATAA